MRAMRETTSSTSVTSMVCFRCAGGSNIIDAPDSSITSMALSGNLRSPIWRAESSTAAFTASSVNFTLWNSSK